MNTKRIAWIAAILLGLGLGAAAQMTSWLQWTFLPPARMDEIVGEASGETAYNSVMAMCGFPRDRKPDEYAGTFREAQFVLDRLKEYGLQDAAILRFPGGETWDGVKGELWEVSPGRQKIASYTELTAMLAQGSASADVTADLVWVGDGEAKDFTGLEVKDKIVVTSGSPGMVHNTACLGKGAAGVISFSSPRPLFDPLLIPWGGIGGRGGGNAATTKFAFCLPPREGVILRDRLKRGEKITVRAVVESKMEKAELQDIVASIPGTDPKAQEVIVSAHIFEGYTMFGANDNSSGSATILEAARTLQALIRDGRLPKPKRTIRFLWAPEFSGTVPYVKANPEQFGRTLCDINLDMVGDRLTQSLAFFTVMRTTYGNPHFLNDVMENYYRYVGEATRSYVTNGMSGTMNRRIVAPTGSEEPMYYYIGTHFGSSDHEVFNDWGVGVPGVVLNTWPDQWYHTSEDRPDKLDPTQLKRAVIITAAAAYTIAAADDAMAGRIAAEIVSNAAARIGHQLARGLEEMTRADAAAFPAAVKRARGYIEASARNERSTLDSTLQMVANKAAYAPYLAELKASVVGLETAQLRTYDQAMRRQAAVLGLKPIDWKPSDAEKKAALVVPKPQPKIKAGGYQGYQTAIQEAMKAMGAAVPDRSASRNYAEIQLLCDGKNSALDIKKMLDTQLRQETPLAGIVAYLEVLKKAGLVAY
ncbi:MAG: M28 family peptidase [Candidatus Aminicenantes bacterium]|nr:M28 family peptidase [Candidatus Aminicenantes bacterium]